MFLSFVGITLILSIARAAVHQDGSLLCSREGLQCSDCNTSMFCVSVAGKGYKETNVTTCPKEKPYCDENTGECKKEPDANCLAYECKAPGPFCLSCSMVVMCAPKKNEEGYYQAWNLTCPTEAPFCDFKTGTCSSVLDGICGKPDTDFDCYNDGYLPSATNCSEYHVCSNLSPRKLSCPPGKRYNPDAQICDSSAPCDTVSCGNDEGLQVPFKDYPRFYSMCGKGGSVFTGRCPGVSKLNFTSQKCEARCDKPGLLPYADDCTKYVKCQYEYINSTDRFMVKVVKNCPEGNVFEPTEFQCIPRDSSRVRPSTCNTSPIRSGFASPLAFYKAILSTKLKFLEALTN